MDSSVQLYKEYVPKTFIAIRTRRTRNKVEPPMFPHHLWNKFNDLNNDEILTNNSVEAWNLQWQKSLRRNPTIWDVIGGIRREAGLSEILLKEINEGTIRSNKTCRSTLNITKVCKMKEIMKSFTLLNCKEYLKKIIPLLWLSLIYHFLLFSLFRVM